MISKYDRTETLNFDIEMDHFLQFICTRPTLGANETHCISKVYIGSTPLKVDIQLSNQ